MAKLYADEDFDYPTVLHLRFFGIDVLTAQESGQAQQRITDAAVLAFAHALSRAVLTYNRRHFIRLHSRNPAHSGIIVCSRDPDSRALAARIHQALTMQPLLKGRLIRIPRPPWPFAP